MPSMADMVEAHLVNVQREIATLQERKVAIDAEIAKLESYLQEGKQQLQQAASSSDEEESKPAIQPVKQSSLF